MSFGLVVVAGQDGAPSEFIDDGKTGFLLSGHDLSAACACLSVYMTIRGYAKRLDGMGVLGS